LPSAYGVLNGELVVIGSLYGADHRTKRYTYDFTTGLWKYALGECNRGLGDFAVLNDRLHIVGGASTSSGNSATPFAVATVPYSQPAPASLTSDVVPLPFGATRVLTCISLQDAYKYDALASTTNAAVYGADWSNAVSLDAGSTWLWQTNMTPIISTALSNSFYSIVTNIPAGSSLMQKISVNAGTVVRAKLWSRFGGK
jgi:hypothetical protein